VYYFWKRDRHILTAFVIFGVGTYLRGGRATHLRGTGGGGTFVAEPAPGVPANAFFTPGKEFRAYIRHGSVANDDDTSLDIRGAALKLFDRNDPDGQSLDLLMNTGEVSFSTARDFLKYAKAGGSGSKSAPINVAGLKRYLESDPRARRQFCAGLRRTPSSFSKMRYHSQIIYVFNADDGLRRFARFRLTPDDDAPEEGIPTREELETPWEQERLKGETRDFGYLRDEFQARCASAEGARYRLEVQIWQPPDENQFDVKQLDPGEEWEHPWHRLGVVHLTRRMSAVETEQIWFNLENVPSTLGFMECKSIDDFASIPFTRIRVYRLSQSIRSSVFWMKERSLARRRYNEAAARGTHGLDFKERRDSSIWNLLFSFMRR
jgi:catalase